MNKQLLEVYYKSWEKLTLKLNEIINNDFHETKPTNPLLISVNEVTYQTADIKVMIFGQETNDWDHNFHGNIESTIETYDDFYNSGYAQKSYGGHFWNGYNRFLLLLGEKYPGKTINCIWNNTIKIGASGRNKNNPPSYIYDIEHEHFDVISSEIKILKPDVIIFLSGPNYDNEIIKALKKIDFKQFDQKFNQRQIAKINYKDFCNVYRTYHPNYLWRNNINNYFTSIIDDITL